MKSFDSSNSPDLTSFPSASMQGDEVELVPAKRLLLSKMLWLIVRLFVLLIVVAAIIAGVAYFVVSSGPISNEQVRSQVESQLSGLLGKGHSARIGDAQIAFGTSGLIALDASNVKLLAGDHVNLGVASDLSVTIKALPILSGNVVAESVSLSNAAISLDNLFLTQKLGQNLQPASANKWPSHLNVQEKLSEVYQILEAMTDSIASTGIEKVTLRNTKVVGFDSLGLKSNSARLIEFVAEKDARFQTGLFFEGTIETPLANWNFEGHWKEVDEGGKVFGLELDGFGLNEFISDEIKHEFFLNNSVKLTIDMPFDNEGVAGDATVAMELEDGTIRIGKHYESRVLNASFNGTLMPSRNQFELNPSPVQFPNAEMVLVGGVRYPGSEDEAGDTANPALFEVIANDIRSTALDSRMPEVSASLVVSGLVRPEDKSLVAQRIALSSATGGFSGTGAMAFEGETPSLKLDLKMAKMDVEAFKQLWPPFLAAKARLWSKDNLSGGKISNAWVKADIPSGILGRIDKGAKLKPSYLKSSLPVSGTTIRTLGKIPRISAASGDIRQSGMTSDITLNSGKVKLKKGRVVSLAKSTMKLGDFEQKPIATSLQLNLAGSADAMAALGTFEPLSYTKSLGVSPGDLKGKINAKMDVSFGLADEQKITNLNWSGDVVLSNVSSTKPVAGRELSNANLKVDVQPGLAKVTGTADLDGVPAKVALLERFGSKNKKSKRSVTLTLSDKDRKKLGFDLGEIMVGPIDVTITTIENGSQRFDADLSKAKLDLPWIHWRKGKGIRATASFDLDTNGKTSKLRNFTLRGKGFGAKGTMTVDKAGLVSANLKKVRLNKGDDFDIVMKRSKGMINVNVNARNYDGRAIVRSFIENKADDATAKSKQQVVVKATVRNLLGFGGQTLKGVSLDYTQKNGKVVKAVAKAVAAGNAPTTFSMKPLGGKMRTDLNSANAGAVLSFLDLYSKVRGGTLKAQLESTDSRSYSGRVWANDFVLLNEPRLGELLKPASQSTLQNDRDDATVVVVKKSIADPRKAKVSSLTAYVSMAPKFLKIAKGRLKGGDAQAAFDGVVYDSRNRTKIKGTYLPASGLNKAVSKIPLIGLAFGDGRKRGLIGVTFKMTGNYSNPKLVVNPISIIAPGVFRDIFKF